VSFSLNTTLQKVAGGSVRVLFGLHSHIISITISQSICPSLTASITKPTPRHQLSAQKPIMSRVFAGKTAPKLVSAWRNATTNTTSQYILTAKKSSANARTFQSTRQITTEPRPFQILGLQQIAIGNVDKGPLSDLWTDIFGVSKIGNFKSEKENVDEDILRLGKEGSPHAVEIDLMMPIDETKSPKVSGFNVMCTYLCIL
jgi:hypothetical protein